ncbi:replication/maintenance protein RepL, partial [Priestia megaterium]|uniref:replication/maintenance protein RepL n=1 Tax=Priestia megaterium TaxID=1404 RepID=UPI001649CAD0
IRIEEGDGNLDKIWLGDIVESVDLIGNKKVKVVRLIMDKVNREKMFLMSYKEIEEKLGICEGRIGERMKGVEE